MTTAMCYRPGEANQAAGRARVALPVLGAVEETQANPRGITGPRSLSSVQMLRISVTDVCNLRCVYCMPEEGVEWLPKADVLSFEEIVVDRAGRGGRGHHPFQADRGRADCAAGFARAGGNAPADFWGSGFVADDQWNPARRKQRALGKTHDAGLNRITFSLDSLKPDRFSEITRGGDFRKVWAAIERAIGLGFDRVKVNVVVMRGMNEDEVADFAALTRHDAD